MELSILLDSLKLKKQESQEKEEVPSIHDVHFNEEMLGDEWLSEQLKRWKLLSAGLSVLLIVSWVYFFYQNRADTQPNIRTADSVSPLTEEPVLGEAVSDLAMPPADNRLSLKKKTGAVEKKSLSIKQKYTPQMRKKVTSSPEIAQNNKANLSAPNNRVKRSRPKSAKATGPAISKDELSEERRQQFPEVKIDSYVVADTPEDSFIILDGGFYKVNQVIAPNLLLRQIKKEHMVVEFHSQLVTIPYK